jgi:hypothetical protein
MRPQKQAGKMTQQPTFRKPNGTLQVSSEQSHFTQLPQHDSSNEEQK